MLPDAGDPRATESTRLGNRYRLRGAPTTVTRGPNVIDRVFRYRTLSCARSFFTSSRSARVGSSWRHLPSAARAGSLCPSA